MSKNIWLSRNYATHIKSKIPMKEKCIFYLLLFIRKRNVYFILCSLLEREMQNYVVVLLQGKGGAYGLPLRC